MSCNCKKEPKRCACDQDNNQNDFIRRNPYAERVDVQGRTALHRAARRGDVPRVRELLAEGFDPLLCDLYGKTPLIVALDEPQETVAELLIETNSGLSITDRMGDTPLHIAAYSGFERLVKKLLLMDVDPHSQNDNGEYPLDQALSASFTEIAAIILGMCAWKDISIDYEEMDLSGYKREFCDSVLSKCYSEIKDMKETKIKGASVTFYQIAADPVDKVARYLGNENVCKILNFPLGSFPIYSDLLESQVKRAKEMRELYDQFAKCFTKLAKLPAIPATCTDIILRYLSTSDMHNFMAVVKFKK